jgi:hypothetical protein
VHLNKWLVSFQPQQYVDRFCPGTRFVKESPIYQEIIDLGVEQGREQGLEQGRVLALRAAILRVVQRRFAPLFAIAEPHIIALSDPAKLQAILDDLPYAPDEAAARSILGLPTE